VQIMILLTLLTFLPAIIISLSSFTRIIIVFHFLRQALGTQEAPSNQILIALALFLSFFIMNPTLTAIYNDAYEPWSKRNRSSPGVRERIPASQAVHVGKYSGEGSATFCGDV